MKQLSYWQANVVLLRIHRFISIDSLHSVLANSASWGISFLNMLTLLTQGRSKRSVWCGFGRTNNRAENFVKKIFLLFINWLDLARIIMEPVICSIFFFGTETTYSPLMWTLAFWCPSHSMASRQSSTFDGWEEPPGEWGYRWPLQRPPTRRRDYHDGNHRCVEQLFRLKLPLNKFRGQCYDGAGNMSGKRMGVAKRKHELGSRTV